MCLASPSSSVSPPVNVSALAGRQLDDVLAQRADAQLRARAGPAGSRPAARPVRPRRARGGRSRRAPRACRGSSSAARRPSPPGPSPAASPARARRARWWRRSSCGAYAARYRPLGGAQTPSRLTCAGPAVLPIACLGPSRPVPRVGARARIAHFGGSFEPGTVVAVSRGGTAPERARRGGRDARVRPQPGDGALRLGRRARTARGWSCSADPALTALTEAPARRGSARRSARAAPSRDPRALVAGWRRDSAPAARAGA